MSQPYAKPLHTIGRYALFSLEDPWKTVLLKEPGTRLGQDPEELHDMRVGLRRVRTGVAIFKEALPESLVALQPELKWLGTSLGGARDFDVLIDHVQEVGSRLPLLDSGALARIVERLEAGRREARDTMLAALDSGRWVDLQFAMSEALDQWPKQDRSGSSAVSMRKIVRKLHDRFTKDLEEVLKKPSAEGLHQLRIRAKRLRYAAMFSSRLFGETAVAYAKGLGKLQDVLGKHQDAIVVQEQLRLIADCDDLDRAAVFGAGILAQGFQGMAEESLSRWRSVLDVADGTQWREFRRVMRDVADAAKTAKDEQSEPPAEDDVSRTEDHPPKG